MKKIIMLAAAAIIAVASVSAQTAVNPSLQGLMGDSHDISTERIKIEDKYPELHEKSKNVEIELEYIPLTHEVHLYYKTTQSSFDEGEAMNVSMAVYDDFAVEHKYKHKRYVQKDKVKFYKDERGVRMAEYISYVIFSK